MGFSNRLKRANCVRFYKNRGVRIGHGFLSIGGAGGCGRVAAPLSMLSAVVYRFSIEEVVLSPQGRPPQRVDSHNAVAYTVTGPERRAQAPQEWRAPVIRYNVSIRSMLHEHQD